MNIIVLRELYAYNTWAHQEVWEGAKTLTEDQFHQVIGDSSGTIYEQIFHSLTLERYWLTIVQDQFQSNNILLPTLDDYPSGASLGNFYADTSDFVEEVLATLDDADLAEIITYRRPSGSSFQKTCEEILMQVYKNSTDNRAKTITMLKQLGVSILGEPYVRCSMNLIAHV